MVDGVDCKASDLAKLENEFPSRNHMMVPVLLEFWIDAIPNRLATRLHHRLPSLSSMS